MAKDLQNLMREYFDVTSVATDPDACLIDFLPQIDTNNTIIPIEPKDDSWQVVESPKRLMKTYEFQSHQNLSLFMEDLLGFQQEFNHYAKITIDYPKIIIEVYTHDVDDITELDKEYAGITDEIYRDTALTEFGSDDEGINFKY